MKRSAAAAPARRRRARGLIILAIAIALVGTLGVRELLVRQEPVWYGTRPTTLELLDVADADSTAELYGKEPMPDGMSLEREHVPVATGGAIVTRYVRVRLLNGEPLWRGRERAEAWTQALHLRDRRLVFVPILEAGPAASTVAVGLRSYLTRTHPWLTADDVAAASVRETPEGPPALEVKLTADGADKLAEATKHNLGGRIAFIVGGSFVSVSAVERVHEGRFLTVAMESEGTPEERLDAANRQGSFLNANGEEEIARWSKLRDRK